MNISSSTRRVVATILTTGMAVLALGPASAATASMSSPVPAVVAPGVVNDGEGPQLYADQEINITDDVDGDVYAAAENITITGNITGDVIAAAQTIIITGNVDGNVRLAAEDVTINGDVSRSGTIFAADITVSETASFGDDLVGAAADVAIDGTIGRDLQIGVENLTIDGAVGGDVTYESGIDARIADGAVSGTVERIIPEELPVAEVTPGSALGGWALGLLYALIAFSIITALTGLLLPRLLHQVTDRLLPTPWKALLVGLVASITVPVTLLIVLVTVIGAPLAFVGSLIWLILTLSAFVYGAYYIGRLVFRGGRPPVLKAFVGGVILIVALNIPWLNIAVWVAMVWLGLGAQLLALHGQRPWLRNPRDRVIPTPPPAPAPARIQDFAQTQA